MRVLFVAIPERGHLNPLIAVAERLEAWGHDVAFLSHGHVATAVAAGGLRARVFDVPASDVAPRLTRARVDNVAWLARWFELATTYLLGAEIREAARSAVLSFQPDVMAVDPLAYNGVVAAEACNIPWAGLSTNFLAFAPDDWTCPMREANERIAGSRRAMFAANNIRHPVTINEVSSPWLRIVFTTEAFVPGPSNGIFRVGPALALGPRADSPGDFPWDRLASDHPLIYVSSGGGESLSLPFWSNVLDTVFASLGPDEAQFVATLHELAESLALPPHVVGVRYAPQLALLERVAAVVTQGGANTVTESLAYGRPMLVMPGLNDQSLQAVLVERAGVGFSLDPAKLDATECRDRLREILREDGPEQRRAKVVADSFRAHDGATRAAELIAELARERRELRPEA